MKSKFKKFLLFLLIFMAVAVGGISFMFYESIDEESYKQQIIASTKEMTGCDMVIAGQMKMQLFPSPVIRISNVLIKNKAGFKSADFMKIADVEAHIRFSSLLKNPLVVDNIILKEPQVFLSRNENGENNWSFALFKPAAQIVSKDDLLGQTFTDVPPQFQNVEIVDGTINYQNALSNSEYQLTNINGKLNSSSITGPFDFVGTMKQGQMPLNVTLHVDKLNLVAQTKFDLSLLNPSSKAVLSVQSGKIEKLSEVGQSFSGTFTFNIPKLSSFLVDSIGFKDLPEPLNKQIVGNGSFNISDKNAALTEVAVRYGNEANENAVAADINFIFPLQVGDTTKVSSLLRFSNLNLDTFISYLPKPNSWQDVLVFAGNKLPTSADLVLNAEKITLFDQAIKNVVFSADIHDKSVNIREAKALLPQDTFVQTSGSVSLDGKEPTVNVNYSIEAGALQQTLDWLKINKIPANLKSVNSLNFSGQMRLRPKDLTFSNMDLALNNGNITGGLAFALTEPKLTGYANLNLKQINFDDFFPYTAPTEKRSLTEWLKDVKNTLDTSFLLSDINVSLLLSGQDITFKTLPIQLFTYEGKIKDKNWITDKLQISQAAMSNIDYKGVVQKLADNTVYFKDVVVALEMPKSLLLLDRLKIKSPLVNNASKIDLKASLAGSFDKMSINSDIMFTQGRIRAQGDIENILTTNPNYSLGIKIVHPNFHQFMRLFNSGFNSLPTLSGNFTFDSTLQGDSEQLTLNKTELSIGAQRLQGDLKLQYVDDSLKINGKINSPYLYLDKFFSGKNLLTKVDAGTGKSQFSSNLLKFDALENVSADVQLTAEKIAFDKLEWALFSSHILLDDKILMLDDVKASVDGGNIALSSVLNCSTATPFLKGNIKMDKVPLRADMLTLGLFRLKSGDTSLMMDFDTKGNSVEDMIQTLSSTGRFNIQNGAVSSLNLNAFERRVRTTLARRESMDNLSQQLNKEMTVGETAFDSLEGSFAITNGVFRTSDTVLKTPNANAIIQMNLDLPDWTVSSSAAITLKKFTGYPPISIVVKGLAHSAKTSIDFASFIKYLESSSNDMRIRLMQEEQTKQAALARQEARGRVTQLSALVTQASQQIADAQKALQIAPSDALENELIRAKDAFVLLQELANKPAPSVADTEKANEQASLIATRTSMILNQTTQTAATAIRADLKQINDAAQEKMHSINRIHQRLAGVESVDQAYQKGFSTMTLIQQLLTFVNSSMDLEKLQTALTQAKDALDIMDLAYESIAKFDIDAETPYQQTEPAPVRGSIRRS